MPVKDSPMIFGRVVHQTIEDIHKTDIKGEELKINPARIVLPIIILLSDPILYSTCYFN
jgi:hypothetical protein